MVFAKRFPCGNVVTILLALAPSCIEAGAAVYMTELTVAEGRTTVELLNSAEETKSVEGWKISVGERRYDALSDSLQGYSLKSVIVPIEVSYGDTVAVVDRENDTIDFAFPPEPVVFPASLFRDTANLYDGRILPQSSKMKTRRTEGSNTEIFEQDRTELFYRVDEETGDLVAEYKSRRIKKEGLREHVLAMDENPDVKADVYPNLVTSLLFVFVEVEGRYDILLPSGRAICSGTLAAGENAIDMTCRDSGFYVVRVWVKGETRTFKIEKI
mgnify:CR=1 FL=1